MKTIKVKFVDFYKTSNPKTDFIYQALAKHYNIEFSNDPDYLIFSLFGNEHLKYNNCVKIFYTGECLTPDFNLCDYAIGFDYMDFGDRFFRYPVYYPMQCAKKENIENARNMALKNDAFKEKGFCSFVYSNGNADSIRKLLFDKINEYKTVTSGGRYLNNMADGKPVNNKIEFQSKYKFCIACENAAYPGYTTEKLLQAYESGALPIYWGDPLVENVFDKRTFINCNEYDSLDDVVKKIIEIDNNDELYKEMMSISPIKNEKDYFDHQFEELEKWLVHIIEQPLEKAKRYSRGYYNVCVYQKRINAWHKAYNHKPVQIVKKLLKPIYYKVLRKG